MPCDFKTGFLLKLSKNLLRESWYELSLFGYTAWGAKDGHFSFFQSLCQIGLTCGEQGLGCLAFQDNCRSRVLESG